MLFHKHCLSVSPHISFLAQGANSLPPLEYFDLISSAFTITAPSQDFLHKLVQRTSGRLAEYMVLWRDTEEGTLHVASEGSERGVLNQSWTHLSFLSFLSEFLYL